MKRSLVKWGIPLLILVIGAGGFALLRATATPPRRIERQYKGPLVETIEVPAGRTQIVVEGQGTVRPANQIDLVPQVGGIVVWKSPQLEPGGLFAKGRAQGQSAGMDTARMIGSYVRHGLKNETAAIAFMADLYDGKGIAVPFFGRDAKSTPFPAPQPTRDRPNQPFPAQCQPGPQPRKGPSGR